MTYTAQFIGTDHDGPSNEKRDWFLVADDAQEIDYAVDEDGALLDSDGAAIHDNDDETAKVRSAIRNAREKLVTESSVYQHINAVA